MAGFICLCLFQQYDCKYRWLTWTVYLTWHHCHMIWLQFTTKSVVKETVCKFEPFEIISTMNTPAHLCPAAVRSLGSRVMSGFLRGRGAVSC